MTIHALNKDDLSQLWDRLASLVTQPLMAIYPIWALSRVANGGEHAVSW